MNRPSATVPSVGRRQGMGLVDVTISVVIVGVMLVAAMNTAGAAKLSETKMTLRKKGTLLAQGLMAEILTQSYTDPTSGPGSFGIEADEVGDGSRALWDDVDDYDGWSASPPESKDGTVIPDLDGWGRQVAVAWINPSDLMAPSGAETNVKRITVTVTKNGLEVGLVTAIRTLARDTMENR